MARAKRVSPPDLDGDGEPGGSLPRLAHDVACAAWAACNAWAVRMGLDGDTVSWADMTAHERVGWAIEAKLCMDDPAHLPHFDAEVWESGVRAKVFAAVCGAIGR